MNIEKAKKVVEKVKKKVEVRDEKLENLANEIIERINTNINSLGIKAKAKLGGSFAKGTYLPGTTDIDIHLIFHAQYTEEDLKELTKKIVSHTFEKYEVLHGSRDYYQVKVEGIIFEIVPLVDISDNFSLARNVIDFSPFHVDFVREKIKEKEGLEKEIKIAKLFFKAQNLYGAESYMQGFSGYVIELLIIYYGSFIELLKNAVKWKRQVVIKFKECKKKFESPLIIYDPVQPERNAAAAVSKKRFNMLKDVAAKFLEKPSEEFFVIKKYDVEKFKEELCKNNNVLMEVKMLEGKKDIVAAKAVKALKYLESLLNKEEFKVVFWDFFVDEEKMLAYFTFKSIELEKYKIIVGPPKEKERFVEEFKRKHKEWFVKDNRIYAKEKRKFINAREFIEHTINNDPYFKDKVKSINIIRC